MSRRVGVGRSVGQVHFDPMSKLAKEENLDADVFGPLAFDNSISKKSAAIKGIKNGVVGMADVLLVPNVETGNSLVKMIRANTS